jgi:flavin reductase (DIM6/NTAB) family NADH-FMN oxidoreductase RutF
MCDQHPDGGAGAQSCTLREYLRSRRRQIQGLSTYASSSLAGEGPLIDECYANLECKVVDAWMVAKYNFFILKVQKAWIAPSTKRRRTIHHLGKGAFMVAGRTIKLPSKMK